MLWVIEGIGSYGATLSRAVTEAGYPLAEAPRMDKRSHAAAGKDDHLDARQIARSILPLDLADLRLPRQDHGVRSALQVLLTARDRMTRNRTAARNALNALVRVHDLGIDARRALTNQQVTEIASWRKRAEPVHLDVARREAVRLAKQVIDAKAELVENEKTIKGLVQQSPGADLRDLTGFGPINSAQCYVSWSHPGRVRDEAAFARLAGVAPIPASSGNTTRHRLSRYGDRKLNSALDNAAKNRAIWDPESKAYFERRISEGKTEREARRCLKRFLARRVYRTLEDLAHATSEPVQTP